MRLAVPIAALAPLLAVPVLAASVLADPTGAASPGSVPVPPAAGSVRTGPATAGATAVTVPASADAVASPGVASASPAAAAAAAAPGGLGAVTGPQVGLPAPDFSVRTLDGKTLSLASFRGRTLVLNAWATWCPPCRLEMPGLIAEAPKLRALGAAVLGIDSTETAGVVRAYAASRGVTYPLAIDASRAFRDAYDVAAIPTTFVIDPQGVVRARIIDVVAPPQLRTAVVTARAGRDVTIVSALQARIDASLAPANFTFADASAAVPTAKRVAAAIAQAETLADEDDPAKGQAVDLLRTRAEEASLRTSAISMLGAAGDAPGAPLALVHFVADAARDREAWSEALREYGRVLAQTPDDTSALDSSAYAAEKSEAWDAAIAARTHLAALAPTDSEALLDEAVDESRAGRATVARATFERGIALARAAVAAKPGDASALRALAHVEIYAGRAQARANDAAGARALFLDSLATAERLPARDPRHDMYLEENQEAIAALGLDPSAPTALTLAPWTGPELPGSIPDTPKYRLVVAGRAGKTVALRAAGVPRGWLASFCSDRVCSPSRLDLAIPASGVKVVEFQLIPPAGKPAAPRVRVVGNDGGATSSATT